VVQDRVRIVLAHPGNLLIAQTHRPHPLRNSWILHRNSLRHAELFRMKQALVVHLGHLGVLLFIQHRHVGLASPAPQGSHRETSSLRLLFALRVMLTQSSEDLFRRNQLALTRPDVVVRRGNVATQPSSDLGRTLIFF
jgi:hypothetical protein